MMMRVHECGVTQACLLLIYFTHNPITWAAVLSIRLLMFFFSLAVSWHCCKQHYCSILNTDYHCYCFFFLSAQTVICTPTRSNSKKAFYNPICVISILWRLGQPLWADVCNLFWPYTTRYQSHEQNDTIHSVCLLFLIQYWWRLTERANDVFPYRALSYFNRLCSLPQMCSQLRG